MISFLIGLAIGSIGGLVAVYLVYRNNKNRINDLLATAKEVGVVLSK